MKIFYNLEARIFHGIMVLITYEPPHEDDIDSIDKHKSD